MAENVSTLMVNRPPAITWHRLKMNDVAVELPDLPLAEGFLAAAPASSLEGPAPSFGTPRFAAQTAAPSSCAALLHAFTEWVPAEPIGEYGVQRVPAEGAGASGEDAGTADSIVEGCCSDVSGLGGFSGSQYYESGMGLEAEQWLESHASGRVVVDVPAGEVVEDPVVFNVKAQQGRHAVLLLDLVARADSRVHVVVQSEAESDGEGTVGVYARIVAHERARVEFTSLQALGEGWTYLENSGLLLGDDARVNVRQTILGGSKAYVGLGANQVGDRSALDVDVRYLGTGDHVLDFNYAMRMRGRGGDCRLNANGVLVDAASKTLRDTIDLVHGCKGSVGNENETVLLANEQVRNKSIPVILCDEDDVQGNHGATIGHVNPSQLEYLQSRGLTVPQIEALFTSAMYDYAAEHAVTAEGEQAVRRLAQRRLGE